MPYVTAWVDVPWWTRALATVWVDEEPIINQYVDNFSYDLDGNCLMGDEEDTTMDVDERVEVASGIMEVEMREDVNVWDGQVMEVIMENAEQVVEEVPAQQPHPLQAQPPAPIPTTFPVYGAPSSSYGPLPPPANNLSFGSLGSLGFSAGSSSLGERPAPIYHRPGSATALQLKRQAEDRRREKRERDAAKKREDEQEEAEANGLL